MLICQTACDSQAGRTKDQQKHCGASYNIMSTLPTRDNKQAKTAYQQMID